MQHSIDHLQPCLSGETIAHHQEIQPYLRALKQLVSAPSNVYADLYLNTLHRFMELCQAMPDDLKQPEPYSLLKRRLDLVVTALKLRRGKMLPLHADSESIAEQEPLWTYAVFTVCLLNHIDQLQIDRTVEFYKDVGERLGSWHPISGSLFERHAYYHVQPKKDSIAVDPPLYRALLIGKIIPTCAIRWLIQQPAVFATWWETFFTDVTPKNCLTDLLHDAQQKIPHPVKNSANGYKASNSSPHTSDSTHPSI